MTWTEQFAFGKYAALYLRPDISMAYSAVRAVARYLAKRPSRSDAVGPRGVLGLGDV